jgi:hypothetical protein
MSSCVIIIIVVHWIIIITYMVVHKFIHYVSVEQTVIILIHFTESPGWSNPENNPRHDRCTYIGLPRCRAGPLQLEPFPLDREPPISPWRGYQETRAPTSSYSVTCGSLAAWTVPIMRTPCIPLAWIARDMPPTYNSHGLVVHEN